MAEIYLAGGCFWGLEEYIKLIKGVNLTKVGYANGNTENPTYEEVCYKNTGHAETVKVIYDEKLLPLDFLLNLFYEAIDPTSINRQGGDTGTQYRTGIYYTDSSDFPVIKRSLENLQKSYTKSVVIEALPLSNFFEAEEYHQKYLNKNPQGYCHIGKDKFEKASNAIFNTSTNCNL